MFITGYYTCLWFCSQGGVHLRPCLGRHSPRRHPPPPGHTSPDRHPPPPGHTSPDRHPPGHTPLSETALQLTVRILVECILVVSFINSFVLCFFHSIYLSFVHSLIHSFTQSVFDSFIVRSFFVSCFFFRYGSIIGYFHHIGFRGQKLEQFIKTISET